MSETVYEIALLGRIRIDAHSLNNEGTIGNVAEPRTVVLSNGEKTDGISGEMLKHIHSRNVWRKVAAEETERGTLCESCRVFDPTKAGSNSAVTKEESALSALSRAIECPLCDIHGFLVEKPTVSRKSTVEFGWALALPQHMHRTIHLHTRVAPGEKEKRRDKPEQSDEEEKVAETAQMIYHRPTRAGIYALVSVFQPWRIGLNEVNYKYVIDDNRRRRRTEVALDAYRDMLIQLEGAMTSTRLPHIGELSGVVVKSGNPMPVCAVSPLADNYVDTVQKLSQKLEQTCYSFTDLETLVKILDELKKNIPYRLAIQD
jgi:CRISPR-associated protein Cst2